MAGSTYVEHIRVLWFEEADTPEEVDAITAAELADAFDVTLYVADYDHGGSNDRVDDSDFLSPFKKESAGTFGNQPWLLLRRKLKGVENGEEAFEAFQRGEIGTLVFFETLDRGVAPATGSDYKAYPLCEVLEPQEQKPAKNESVKFRVDFAVGDTPVRGTVVAS